MGGAMVRGMARLAGLLGAALGLAMLISPAARAQPASLVDSGCLQCHAGFQGQANTAAGAYQFMAGVAHVFMISADGQNLVFKFTSETQVSGVDSLQELQKPMAVLVSFEQRGPERVATQIKAMPVVQVPDEQRLDLAAMQDLAAQGPALGGFTLLDSRPAPAFAQGHLPGALSLPFSGMAQHLAQLPPDKQALLIFYGAGPRDATAPLAAQLAAKQGHAQVKVFQGGAPAWAQAGLPLLTSPQYLAAHLEHTVLLDTRPAPEAQQGHLPGAISLPLEDLSQAKGQFPLDHHAPIVLISQGTDLDKLAPAVKEISGWGFGKVTVLEGGMAAWQAAGLGTLKDKMATQINYTPQPLPGEIGGQEFMAILHDQPADKVILDVRTPGETASGAIPGALLIPLDTLAARLGELPKDKEIIIHCRTGRRAQMAQSLLLAAGFRARFLNDKVEFKGDQVTCCSR